MLAAVDHDAEPPVAFGVLGPVDIDVAGSSVPLPTVKIRYLAAALILNRRHGLSPPQLTEVLWNDCPPMSAQKNLHQYVHRLRRLFTGCGLPDRLVRRPPAYLLRVDPHELDLSRFEALAAAGRRARDHGQVRTAAWLFDQALSLWRGDPLCDVRDSRILDAAARALAELRICTVEERIAADLVLGRHDQLVPELAALVAEYPLRERLREYQMLALYASGRKAAAVAVYHDCRATLVRELGIDPGPRMQEILSAVLTDDAATLARHVPLMYRESTT
jgi:DNA-binding SARP family transcriptional activator